MQHDTVLDREWTFFGLGDWVFSVLLGVLLLVIVAVIVRTIMKSGD